MHQGVINYLRRNKYLAMLVSNLREDLLPLGLLLFLVILFLHRGLFPLFGNQILSDRTNDIKTLFFHLFFFLKVSIAKGFLPLWNPYIYSGTPYIATIQSAVFYPANWLFLILPISTAINISVALHLFLSGSFTYYLLKHYGISRTGCTISGIIYTFCAPHILHIYAGHPVYVAAVTWTPLLILLADKLVTYRSLKYSILLAFIISLQLLAGYPQILFYSLITLLFYFLFIGIKFTKDVKEWQKVCSACAYFALSILLGFAISAIQIVPAAEMTGYSTRQNLSYEFVSTLSFSPQNLLTFLLPDFFGNGLEVPYWGKNYLWEMTAYSGIFSILLSAIALFCVRKKIVSYFALLILLSIILAMGKYTPILKILYAYVPGFNLFRINAKWIYLCTLSLAVLSGFGFDFLLKGDKRRLKIIVAAFSLSLISGLSIIYFALDADWWKSAIMASITSSDMFRDPSTFMESSFAAIAAESFRYGVLWTIAFILTATTAIIFYSYANLRKNILIIVIVSLTILDLFIFGMRYMVTFDNRESFWDTESVKYLKRDKEPSRVMTPNMDNEGMSVGLQSLAGYDTIMIKWYSEFLNFSQGVSPDEPDHLIEIKRMNKLTDLMNAKYLILPSNTNFSNPAFREVFRNSQNKIFENQNALPRAFIVNCVHLIKERDAIFNEIMKPDFNTQECAIIEEELSKPLAGRENKNPAPRFLLYSPNTITIEANLNKEGFLVLGDVYYPGWKAYVDGRETKIFKTNYVMRGIVVPSGNHKIEFRYQPFSFKLGAIITLISLIFSVAILVWDRRRKVSKLNKI